MQNPERPHQTLIDPDRFGPRLPKLPSLNPKLIGTLLGG